MLRPRLLERLATVAEAPVSVIHAPAGYGKTTLLAQIAEHERRAVAWLSLDERDDDAVVLVHDLAHAVGEVLGMDAVDPELLARLTAGPAGVLPLALPRLVSWLADSDEPTLIVLDDAHLLSSPVAIDVVHTLCEQLPPAFSLVLSARTRLNLPLARLRADGRLRELVAADLRMTLAEGVEMLRSAGADVEDRDAEFVVRRTEGWPAAIYLAAIVLRSGADDQLDDARPPGPDEADLSEYFLQEVLAGAIARDKDFLIRTAILDELRPSICDVVLERGDSGERLRSLADADLFVTQVDAYGGAYRVHGLFREMLQAELRRGARALAPKLHRRAARAYREERDWERATRHSVAAGDPDVAAEIMWLRAPEYVSHGRSGTLVRWYSWLDEDEVATYPEAALTRAWAAYEAGEADVAVECVAIALGCASKRILPDGSSLRANTLLLVAALASHGPRQAALDAAEADVQLGAANPLRAVALFICGSIAALSRDRAGRTLLEDGAKRAAGRLPTAYALCLAQQAVLEIDENRWSEAGALIARARASQRTAGVEDHTSQAFVAAVLALVLANRGEAVEAAAAAHRAQQQLGGLRLIAPWLALETRVVLGSAFAKLGAGGRARMLLGEGRELMADDPPELLRTWVERLEQQLDGLGPGAGPGPTLTTAELQTLRYLPTHLTARQIGERLYVTRNTVKTHTVAIYRKLGVTSRSGAVLRAQELGLLDHKT